MEPKFLFIFMKSFFFFFPDLLRADTASSSSCITDCSYYYALFINTFYENYRFQINIFQPAELVTRYSV